ncbi:MAG: RagB/SusD family nutrient uptake outer membrane protein [Salinibacter sp.]|uniref:RagB/SusD family nutrient uptake outer membrane protein n=1 Tax=Salinibacter sp. TaxID=2065818 RepID=UPI0035D406B6
MSSYLNRFPSAGIRRVVALSLVLALPLVFGACDQQLEEKSFDQITPENFFQNEQQFVSAVTAVYAHLRGFVFNPLDSQEHSTDEIMVPTRGPDWGDGGIWRNLTQHNWPTTNPQISGSWDFSQVGIARANGVLSSLAGSESISDAKKAQFAAEAKFLRAFFYYMLMDQFGGVPIVVEEGSDLDFPTQPVDANSPPADTTRKAVFNFVLKQLTGCTAGNFSVDSCIQNPGSGTIIGDLAVKGEVPYGRATKGAALALTARILLNAEIYTGEVTTSGINTGTAMYAGAAAAAERVINSGRYQLEDYFKNFSASNQTSDELIFAATYKNESGVAFNKQMAFLHYNHGVPATPWNGFTTIAEFYKSHNLKAGPDGEVGTADDVHTDRRGKQFLVGKQYQKPSKGCAGDECFSNPDSGPVTVRGSDIQLDLTLNIPGIKLGASNPPDDFPDSDVFLLEAPGARPLKFEIDPSIDGAKMGNDYPLFRLAEMYLTKAEAEAKQGNMGAALDAFNEVHTKRGNDALTMGEATDQTSMIQHIVAERGRELHFEFTRRSDLIRYEFAHGGQPIGFEGSANPDADVYAPTFTGPWLFKKDGSKTGQSSEPYRVLFPKPKSALSANPNLTQNPGY